jgi:GTPase Era involved in 16S rRNA processing
MDQALSTVETPRFAVVGHPNKGKSSIVAALAQDDTVAISRIPGTTQEQKSYPFSVDGKVIYELIDTPGFQRPREVLSWLKSHDVSAPKRPEVVRKFIETHRKDPRFHDEIQLLTPVMQGAGIIYVVDASKPYGEEYEAEMEILQWTGQPSMALLNHIDDDDYAWQWKPALHQYFRSVRTFNPMEVDSGKQIAILESMAQLREEWTERIKESITLFQAYEKQKLRESAEVITALMITALTHKERLPLSSEEPSDEERSKVEERYRNYLRELEYQSHEKIEKIWNHAHLEVQEAPLVFEGADLFSQASADIFGLSRKEIMLTAATTGAVTGAGIDLLFAGHTLFVGGAIGAIVGGVGAYFGFDELSDVKVLGRRLGRRSIETGPVKNRNFPYILLGRALYLTRMVATLSHAQRGRLTLEMQENFKDLWLDEEKKKSLERYHNAFRSGKEVEQQTKEEYADIIDQILKRIIATKKLFLAYDC